jgi:hypothetical protein
MLWKICKEKEKEFYSSSQLSAQLSPAARLLSEPSGPFLASARARRVPLGPSPFSPAGWFARAPPAQQREAALSFFDCVTDAADPSVRHASFLKPTLSSLSKNADVESSPQSLLSFRGDAFGLYKSSP